MKHDIECVVEYECHAYLYEEFTDDPYKCECEEGFVYDTLNKECICPVGSVLKHDE
jgi:hypothetical protein